MLSAREKAESPSEAPLFNTLLNTQNLNGKILSAKEKEKPPSEASALNTLLNTQNLSRIYSRKRLADVVAAHNTCNDALQTEHGVKQGGQSALG